MDCFWVLELRDKNNGVFYLHALVEDDTLDTDNISEAMTFQSNERAVQFSLNLGLDKLYEVLEHGWM